MRSGPDSPRRRKATEAGSGILGYPFHRFMKSAFLILALSLSSAPALAQTPAPPATLHAPPPEAVREESGLITQVLLPGTGTDSPVVGDYARMHVTVWDAEGKSIQHTVAPKTLTLELGRMLPGWRMAVEQMVTGETRRAWVPAALGGGKIDDGDTFLIDTALLEIIRPHIAPADVAAAPATATTTKSGLAYQILTPVAEGVRPTRRSNVAVHYSGWTTDGKLFDSSIPSGEPASFSLGQVIPGWTEGLQLMKEGEKARFWVPSNLAYGRDRTKPQGMLVFDIELIDVY